MNRFFLSVNRQVRRILKAFLEHPAWTGIAGLVAIIALLLSVSSDDGKQPRQPHLPPPSGPEVGRADPQSTSPTEPDSQGPQHGKPTDHPLAPAGNASRNITIGRDVGQGAVVSTGDVSQVIVNRYGRVSRFSELPEKVVQSLQNELQVTGQVLEDIYTQLERKTLSPQEFETKLREHASERVVPSTDTVNPPKRVSKSFPIYRQSSGTTEKGRQFPWVVDMEFVLIPAGEFQMGSTDGFDNERPVHPVRISQPFYMGKYEVTQAQWVQVMGNNPSHFKGTDRPVEQVSWEDVQEFIRQLNALDADNDYRLPTEAEWEYAARAGSTTTFSFGDDASQLGEYAWYGDNSGFETHPVGQLKPNAWGLYDMHGNVWEWVQDWYAADYYQHSPEKDPLGPDKGQYRVVRGGGFFGHQRLVRCAFRLWSLPVGGYLKWGFRVVVLPKL